MISMYSPEEPYKVFDQDIWWSDRFDPLQYGRAFDFSRPFFEQFKELELAVPKCSITNIRSENCNYTNYSCENRNSYLLVGSFRSENCYYGYRIFYCKDVCDCYDLLKCERCYECLESGSLYDCLHCEQCFNSSNLMHCKDCTGCEHCFGCMNLRNKEYHIFNEPCSKEEYPEKIQSLLKNPSEMNSRITTLRQSVPHRFAYQIQCEDVSGDQLWNSKDCHESFILKNCRDCTCCRGGEGSKDCGDCNFFDNCELQYHSCNNQNNYSLLFSSLIWYCKNALYSMNCFNSENFFGCTGLKKHQYCILNKQYSKEEYETLVPKIIDHMRKTGEWSNYFPPQISAFGYNETVAHEFLPLTEAEVEQRGWRWRTLDPSGKDLRQSGDTTTTVLRCSVTEKPFKTIPQELKFYTEMSIPIPTKCPDQRHQERMARLNPRKLWNRECASCGKPIATSYSPERSEKVVCEECYLKEVY